MERRAKARDPRVLRVSLGSGCERALREGCWGRRSRSLAGIDARAYFERVLGVVSRARFREGGVSQREREKEREREREKDTPMVRRVALGASNPDETRPLGEILTPPVIRRSAFVNPFASPRRIGEISRAQ